MDPTWVLSLPEYVSVAAQAEGELTLLGLGSPVTLRQLSPGLHDALRRLAAPGESAARLAEHVRTVAGPTALARWYYHLQGLARRCLLRLAVHAGGERLATLEPTSPSFVLPPAGVLPGRSYVLSRFAWVQRRGDVLALESPLSPARIVLHDPRTTALVHALTRPGTPAEVGGVVAGLPAEAVMPLLGLLAHAGAVCAVGDDGATAEDADPALRCWQFHDLLFHARSRQGRHDGPVGAPIRWPGGSTRCPLSGRKPRLMPSPCTAPTWNGCNARIRPSPSSRNAAARSESTRLSRSRTANSANSCTASLG